jgi:ABC-type branched-subunit amino acid transport system ATPase component
VVGEEGKLVGDDKADVIGLTDIVKRYGKFQALDRVSLSVQRGSVHSIIGPNGAGKTTLLQVLSGIVKPDFGRVYVAGVDVSRWSSDRRAKSGLGRSFQVAQLFEDMSALGNVAIAASVSRRRRMIKMV